jgi:integrase
MAVVPGVRKKHSHLPRRVYEKHGALHYVDRANKWHRLGPKDLPLPEIHRKLADLLGPPDTATMAGLIDRYAREVLPKKAPRTAKVQRLELARLATVFGPVRPLDVEPTHCWEYFTARGGTSAAHHEVRLLSHVFTWARRWGVVKINPAQRLGLPTPKARDRYVTDAEFLALRAIAPKMIGYAMDLTLLTALREGDILRIERKHLTNDGIELSTGKTGKGVLIEWSPELREVIAAALREPPQVRRAVICRRDGKPMTESGFQSIWQRLMKKHVSAGGTRFTFHDLRAKSLSDEPTLEGAAARATHADPRITQRVYRRLPQRVKPLQGRSPS